MSWHFLYLQDVSPQEVTVSLCLPRLNPAEAEVQVALTWPAAWTGLRLTGRLVGPYSVYTTTVEVAYPFRPVPEGVRPGVVTARALVPEPCLWDPACAFLYRGILEVFQEERLLARLEFHQGLRRFALGRTGLRCNDQPLWLRGCSADEEAAARVEQLHAQGLNCLLLPSLAVAEAMVERADRFGLLLLARGIDLFADSGDKQVRRLYRLSTHASFLACLLPAHFWSSTTFQENAPAGIFWGLEGIPPASWEQLPAAVSFLVGTSEQLPALRRWSLPKLLLSPADDLVDTPAGDLLGLVRESPSG